MSEYTTTDTSVHDSSSTWTSEDSFSFCHDSLSSDSFTSDHDSSTSDPDSSTSDLDLLTSDHDSSTSDHDTFSIILSESEYQPESNVSGSDGNVSGNMSIENHTQNVESNLEINDTTSFHMETDNVETDQQMDVVHYHIIEYDIEYDESINQLETEVDRSISDLVTRLEDIPELPETSESGRQENSESTTSTFETSHATGNTVSFDNADDWDITNTSLGVPALNGTSTVQNTLLEVRGLSRFYNGWSNAIRSRSRTRSGRKQEKQLTEEEQMAILREEAFRERPWSLEECSICFEVMLQDQPLMQLPCTHNFHVTCIGPWLQEQQTCPNCRKNAD